MQFGIFSVSDITRNPVTGETPREAERIDASVALAKKADEVGLDVFAIGEHHNPPFFSSSPTTLLAHIAAQTERIVLSTAVTLITTNDPVKLAEDYAMLQHLSQGPDGPDARPREHGAGLSVVRAGHPQGPRARAGELQPAASSVARGRRGLGGQLPHARCRASRRSRVRSTTCRRSSGTARSARPRSPSRPPTTATATSPTTSSRRTSTSGRSSNFYRERFAHYGHGTPEQAIVGLGGQAYIAKNSQDAVKRFRPYFEGSPLYGKSYRLEDFMHGTPLSVGSPQEVIEKTLSFQEGFGDYQRQLWIVDHAGLPLEEALEQVELLGTEVVPVLRKEMESRRAPGVPDAPTHACLVRGEVRRRRAAPAAPERQPRRQPHRHLALPGHRPGARRQPPAGRAEPMASRTRIANEAWEALFRAQATVIRELRPPTCGTRVSPTEYGVLYALSKAPDGLRITELGADALLTQAGLSRLVARLESNGLVERVADPADGRASPHPPHRGRRRGPAPRRPAPRPPRRPDHDPRLQPRAARAAARALRNLRPKASDP